MEVKPSDYEFQTEHAQKKWLYFLNLNDCKKVEFIDSVMRPIVVEYRRILKSSDGEQTNLMIDSLLCNDNNKDNFYYWIFREIENITKHPVSQYRTHYGYRGITNIQYTPRYGIDDSLSNFNYDIRAWKDSLGCK